MVVIMLLGVLWGCGAGARDEADTAHTSFGKADTEGNGGTDSRGQETDAAMLTTATAGSPEAGDSGESEFVAIEISPAAPVIEVIDGVIPGGLQLDAVGVTAEGDRIPLDGEWNLDRPDLAWIGETTGVLLAVGDLGGTTDIEFFSTSGQAQVTATIKLHLRDPGGVDETVRSAFGPGGQSDPTLELLYPYDGTVFPRDLTGPLVQWAGATPADTYYLHLDSPTFEYETWMTGLDLGRHEFPVLNDTDVWQTLTDSVIADDVEVTLQRFDGSQMFAPVESTWHIADAQLMGTIYYWEVNTGSVVRLRVGDSAPEHFLELPTGVQCVACHSVSADGSTIAASLNGNRSPWATFEAGTGANRYTSGNDSGFQAISPDGDYVLWGQSDNTLRLSASDSSTVLAMLPSIDGYAPAHPAWSPDGTRIAVAARSGGSWLDFNNSNLWVVDVDLVTPGFSNGQQLVGPAPGRPAVIYPTWSPDSEWIAFGRATQSRTRGGQGELSLIPAEGGSEISLDRACGVGSLSPDQSSACYEPTFMPESRGGYLWLVFVSERTYGNTLTDTNPNTRRKQLWVTAIQDPPQPGSDPSHAAFWLPGQELDNQNMRGTWALDPDTSTPGR